MMDKNNIDNFNFNLPEELIAQDPLIDRSSANLLHVNNDLLKSYFVRDLIELINPKDLLIFNNTKVIPARLVGRKDKIDGALINITLHYKIDDKTWLAFVKNSKRLNIGDRVLFGEDFFCTVLEKLETGEVKLYFSYSDLSNKLEKFGHMPLPPYIKRDNINNSSDKKNYQSIFAKYDGAVASPTASLHFDNKLVAELKDKGIQVAFVTLHVGAGTFLPVKVEDISKHKMHKEYGELDMSTIELINSTKDCGGKIIAVGTTTLRILEYVVSKHLKLQPFQGEIDMFIYPPYEFKIVDRLITNFHLPRSTLFMLVAAFCGLSTIQKAYAYAIENRFRFFSYGDCCLLEKNSNNQSV